MELWLHHNIDRELDHLKRGHRRLLLFLTDLIEWIEKIWNSHKVRKLVVIQDLCLSLILWIHTEYRMTCDEFTRDSRVIHMTRNSYELLPEKRLQTNLLMRCTGQKKAAKTENMVVEWQHTMFSPISHTKDSFFTHLLASNVAAFVPAFRHMSDFGTLFRVKSVNFHPISELTSNNRLHCLCQYNHNVRLHSYCNAASETIQSIVCFYSAMGRKICWAHPKWRSNHISYDMKLNNLNTNYVDLIITSQIASNRCVRWRDRSPAFQPTASVAFARNA